MIRHKTKFTFSVALVYLLVASLTLWLISSQVTKAGETLESRVAVIANKLAQEQKYSELVELVEKSIPTREALDEFVLTEDKTIDFLAEIESIGKRQGVTFETSALEVVEQPGLFNILVIRFVVTGNEARVFKMLEILETLPYHSELRDLSLDNSSDGDSQSVMNVTLAVSLK